MPALLALKLLWLSRQERQPSVAFLDTCFHVHARVKLPRFFPKRLCLPRFTSSNFQQGQSADCVRQIERRCFLVRAIDCQGFVIARLGQLELFLVLVDVAKVANGMSKLQRGVSGAIEGYSFFVMAKRFICVMQVAFNLSQGGESLGQLQPVFGLAGERHGLNQRLPGICRIFKSRVAGLS